jgi:2-polyprenyl-3-methyl-5-hydroxy-6-metoxy-1,4-benzoquinol methylase
MKNHPDTVCDACLGTQFQFLFHHHHNWSVQRCASCALVQVVPRPTKKEVAALYHEDMEHFAPYIEQLPVHRLYFRGKIQEILEQTRTPKNVGARKLHLLDIGCAMGVTIEEAQKQGITAEGIDISKDAVSYCRKQGMKVYPGTLIEFSKKHKNKKYDIITAFETIEHEYSPKLMVETIYSMLRPKGIAVLTTPNYGSMWRRIMGKYWPGYQHPEHLFFFDHQSLFNLCMHIGFTTVTVRKDDNRPFPLSFLFSRAADYFPVFAPVLHGIGLVLKPFPFTNPINPWDDVIVVARK